MVSGGWNLDKMIVRKDATSVVNGVEIGNFVIPRHEESQICGQNRDSSFLSMTWEKQAVRKRTIIFGLNQ